ncbi:sulfatase [Sandaracinobacter neustonicus]|uniref:Sulfatase n=2 Tax=Sandaracinobacter neustonicus TaxID=1715348 RepID=A0A501XME8_9SPHN|nr:sulfatase [Sandaracinobacter neustonicus]
MKKRWILLGTAVVLGAAAYAGWQRYWYYTPGLIAAATNPVQPNQPVNWSQGPATATTPAVKRPPNIILIVADDLGINDISAFSGGLVPTPAIDRLMTEGATVDSFYTGNATCSPSRAAMMTGRYPTRFGFEFTAVPPIFAENLSHGDGIGPLKAIFHKDKVKGIMPYEQMGVPASEVMLPEVLSRAGYHTLHIGKWHLGEADGLRPENQGFDESLAVLAGAAKFLPDDSPDVVNAKLPWDPIDRFIWANLRHAVRWNGGKNFAPDRYMTDYFTDQAVNAIHANRNRPFFMYLAHTAPHTPLQALKSDYDKLGHIKDHRDRVYAAMLVALDRSVATILAKLEQEGLADNTLILFTSDNGGAWYVGMPDLNRPYRGWKATFFEGGIRAPLFARWPARIKPGTHVAGVGSHLDMFATAAAAAGSPLPTDRVMDSMNLLPELESGQPIPPRTLFWRSGDYRVVRDGDWKLQVSARPNRVWLYDLKADPTERHDLSAAMPEKVAELRAKIVAQAAQMPKPLWPALLEGPVRIDVPMNAPWKEGQDYVYWAN